jgi:hypothetical protein
LIFKIRSKYRPLTLPRAQRKGQENNKMMIWARLLLG